MANYKDKKYRGSSNKMKNDKDLGIDDLKLVSFSSLSTDQVLCYNGTNWVNGTVSGGGGSISCFSYDSGSSALVATADLTSTCSALFGDVLISGNTITPDDSNTVTCLGADGTLNISGNLDVQGDFLKLPQADSCSTIVGNSASAGALRYNTTTNTIQVHNGTEFTGITGGGGGLGDLTTAVTTGSANSCETTIQSPTDENIVLDPQGTGTTCVLGNLVVSCDVTSSSDERLKENIMPIENALNVVTAMSGKTFSMKDDESKQCKIGFIAQQIEEHLPHVVATDKDGMKSVDYGKITALLVEAIKELNKKIEDMK